MLFFNLWARAANRVGFPIFENILFLDKLYIVHVEQFFNIYRFFKQNFNPAPSHNQDLASGNVSPDLFRNISSDAALKKKLKMINILISIS